MEMMNITTKINKMNFKNTNNNWTSKWIISMLLTLDSNSIADKMNWKVSKLKNIAPSEMNYRKNNLMWRAILKIILLVTLKMSSNHRTNTLFKVLIQINPWRNNLFIKISMFNLWSWSISINRMSKYQKETKILQINKWLINKFNPNNKQTAAMAIPIWITIRTYYLTYLIKHLTGKWNCNNLPMTSLNPKIMSQKIILKNNYLHNTWVYWSIKCKKFPNRTTLSKVLLTIHKTSN